MPFSFLNAALLVGMAAAALPILIHLFSRRKVAKVPFSSLRFLEEIARKRVRRMRLTQWLILALRVLAVALLALALGRPAFRGDFALGKSRGESAVAVILDDSYSMRVEGDRKTLAEAARERAREVMDAVETDDRIFLLGTGPDEEGADSYPGRASAEDELASWEPGYGTTDLAAAVRRAGAALADASALNKELFVLSDFQANGLGAGVDPEMTTLLGDLPEDVRVYLLPVDEGPIPNTALEEARLEGSAVEQHVVAQVRRYATTGAEDLAVTVESGAEVLGEARLSVPADDGQTAEVSLSRLPASEERIQARLARDSLTEDDVRYVPSLGTGRVNALLVQDPAQQSPYLPLAMAPESDAGRYQITRVAPDALVSADLSDVRLVLLDNVTHVPREALLRLRRWRAAGGVLFAALGDRVDLRYYNESILPALIPGVALGNLLGADEATGSTYTLTPRATGHEAFLGFEAKIGEPLTGASFWRIVEVKNAPGVRTLAEFGPGLPALVQGDGALLFASSLDLRWNNLPTHAAFVPLLHQSIDAVRKQGGGDRVLVGEAVEGIVDRSLVPAGADVVCVGPGGLVLDVQTESVPRGLRVRSIPAPEPGFYEVRAADRILFSQAVNLDTRESDLTPLDREGLRRLFPGDRVTLVEAGASLSAPVREARYGREFWRELVVIVFLLMLVEGWLSRRGVA